MLVQLEKYRFSDRRIHLNVIFHCQVQEENAGVVVKVPGNLSSGLCCALGFFCDYGKIACIAVTQQITTRHLSHGHCLDAGARLSLHIRSCCPRLSFGASLV